MHTLPELQQAFTEWVLRGESQNQITELVKTTNGLTAEQRLQIYRNNTLLGLTEALRDGYPVINKLVGTDFFNLMARNYLLHYPPKAGCLLYFGAHLADFIAGFSPADSLPYLSDVARLEWFWHEAFHEADATSLDIASLNAIHPDNYGALSFILHPTVRLIRSNYPILSIWQLNQQEQQGIATVKLTQGACHLLIYRPNCEVMIMALPEASYEFLKTLAKGEALCQAVDAALLKDAEFALFAALQHCFAKGLIIDYSVKQP